MSEHNFFNNSEVLLWRQDGIPVPSTYALKGNQYILLFIGAFSDSASRTFVPLLKQFYARHHEEMSFEVVFMSRDRTEEEACSFFYREQGEWYTLSHADARGMLPVWLNNYGIIADVSHKAAATIHEPVLLVFDNSEPRRLITRCGRTCLKKDPDALGFPWADADREEPAEFVPRRSLFNRQNAVLAAGSAVALVALLVL